MIDTKNGFKFESTGREEYANCGIIGIDAEGEISEGYDGGIYDTPDWEGKGGWTPEEKLELAVHMIKRWSKYGNVHAKLVRL